MPSEFEKSFVKYGDEHTLRCRYAAHDIDYGKDNDVEMLNHEIKDAFDKITSSLFSLDGGGWIIVSHCITQLKGAILLSVVVQRP